eukprot:190815-Amphidinium_carterae.1
MDYPDFAYAWRAKEELGDSLSFSSVLEMRSNSSVAKLCMTTTPDAFALRFVLPERRKAHNAVRLCRQQIGRQLRTDMEAQVGP